MLSNADQFSLVVTVSITNFDHYLVNFFKKKDFKRKVSENEDLVDVYRRKISKRFSKNK